MSATLFSDATGLAEMTDGMIDSDIRDLRARLDDIAPLLEALTAEQARRSKAARTEAQIDLVEWLEGAG